MKIVQNNSRISILGLVKFLAALAIVLYHTMPYDGYWRQSYLLVEFFFFITGYFTFKHFQKDQKAIQHDDIEAKSIKALKYTAKKFLAFLPFVIIASIMIHAGPIYTFLTTGNITQELAEAIIAIPLDSLFLNCIRIVACGVGISFAAQGSVLGPILYALIYNVPAFIMYFGTASIGYRMGTSAVTNLQESGLINKVLEAASIIGLIVIGGMIYSNVSVNLAITFGPEEALTSLNDILNGIFPGILSFGTFFLFYWFTAGNY